MIKAENLYDNEISMDCNMVTHYLHATAGVRDEKMKNLISPLVCYLEAVGKGAESQHRSDLHYPVLLGKSLGNN
jgi:hypothetical protein